MLELLLKHGAYQPAEICTSTEYRYGRRDNHVTPLKRAVESGCVEDVRELLAAGADVNAQQQQICVKNQLHLEHECTSCDTPLMAAVRRDDIAMMRLLIAHGANVSQGIPGAAAAGESVETPLLVATKTGNERIITELVSSGADVNQSLGPQGTVLHHCCHNDKLVNLLVQLGADPNATDDTGESVVYKVLLRGHVTSKCCLDSVLQTLRLLLPTASARHLQRKRTIVGLKIECTMLVLQHGARIGYSQMFLAKYPAYFRGIFVHTNHKQYSEKFFEFLRAADTNFSGVRAKIARLNRNKCEMLNLDVLEDKLSQPLMLQTLCVISVRRRLRNIRDVGM